MADSNDRTLADLADEVIGYMPDAEKLQWGKEMSALIESTDEDDPIRAEVNGRYLMMLGQVVSNRVAGIRKREERDRLRDRAEREDSLDEGLHLDYDGRPSGPRADRVMPPTISVRNDDGGRQLKLWRKASPRQFVEAVLREQAVIDGRSDTNAMRLVVVRLIQTDERLMGMDSVDDVCADLGIDPDSLALGELDAI